MTLEIDILMGVTENNIRHLGGLNSIPVKPHLGIYKINFSLDEKNLNIFGSNFEKIKILEKQMEKFVEIFKFDDNQLSETI